MLTKSLRASLCLVSLAFIGATTFDTAHARAGRGFPSEGDLKTESEKSKELTQDKLAEREARQIVEEAKARFKNNNSNSSDLENSLRNYPVNAIPCILDAMDTNDETIQLPMSTLLNRLTGYEDFYYSDSSVKTIIGLLKSTQKREVKCSLVGALGNIGPRTDDIKAAIVYTLNTSAEPSVKRAAIDALAHLALQEKPLLRAESTKIIMRELQNQNSPQIRQSALYALSRMRTNSNLVVPAIIKLLDDNYATVRSAACQALNSYHESSKVAVPKLIEMVRTENDSSIRHSALNALQSIDRDHSEVIALYIELMDDPTLSRLAMSYLSSLGISAAPAVPKLITILKTGDIHSKHQAAMTLMNLGPAAKPALPVFSEMLKDPDITLVRYAEQAINRINQTN
ncbi:MAG: HEAT repeat domain-containing protein [Candidatus Melainabacteria bacterium]|nr:HEAT repeat domain-containing protein [Candidatus Melainabacteria bacterium]